MGVILWDLCKFEVIGVKNRFFEFRILDSRFLESFTKDLTFWQIFEKMPKTKKKEFSAN